MKLELPSQPRWTACLSISHVRASRRLMMQSFSSWWEGRQGVIAGREMLPLGQDEGEERDVSTELVDNELGPRFRDKIYGAEMMLGRPRLQEVVWHSNWSDEGVKYESTWGGPRVCHPDLLAVTLICQVDQPFKGFSGSWSLEARTPSS